HIVPHSQRHRHRQHSRIALFYRFIFGYLSHHLFWSGGITSSDNSPTPFFDHPHLVDPISFLSKIIMVLLGDECKDGPTDGNSGLALMPCFFPSLFEHAYLFSLLYMKRFGTLIIFERGAL